MSFETEKDNVGAGWQPIIEQLNTDLLALDPEYDVLQIKEKFGGLRYYIQMSYDMAIYDAQEALIVEAERKSEETCEFCGQPGKPRAPRQGAWIKTTCVACHRDRINARH